MSKENTLSPLEALPQDLLGEILARVAQSGRRNIRQCIRSSIQLARVAQDNRVLRRLNLKPLAMRPLETLHRYKKLMQKCIENGNPEAHYIKGITEYFYYNKTTTGLQHLHVSAEGSYDDGIYLYGIVLLCRGQKEEGKKYLDMLDWQTNKSRAEKCWRINMNALQEITVEKKHIYYNNLRDNKPSRRCKLNDMETMCKKCYYYKQMKKFVALN